MVVLKSQQLSGLSIILNRFYDAQNLDVLNMHVLHIVMHAYKNKHITSKKITFHNS